MILVNLKYIEEKEKIYCYTVKMMLCVHDRLSKKEKKLPFQVLQIIPVRIFHTSFEDTQ